MKKTLGITALALAMLALVASCAATDVVAKVAATSFDALTQALGDKVSWSEADGQYLIESSAGDMFAIAADFKRATGMAGASGSMDNPDFELDFDAAPFLKAGLDMTKLPKTDKQQYILEEGRFMLHFDWGQTPFAALPATASTPQAKLLETFKQILANYRDRIGYHEKLDHYGFALGDGNMFEWAKDMATNDKDMVWVLNPEPLIQAGLDPNKVDGWVFAKVEIKDANGKAQLVDKLLKPFNLK